MNLSNGADRILYFHTGVHKTGSSALQAYLAANSELLNQFEVGYEFPSDADRLAGNGQYLYDQLYEKRLPENYLDELIGVFISDKKISICSSEDFTRFRAQEWNQVKETCHRLQVQIRFVTFVRDIAPYYYSLRGQLIKGGEYSTSFSEFCQRDKYFPVMESVRCLMDLFGRDVMSVIHYESTVNQIDNAFMHVIGVPAERLDNAVLGKLVNRSLTGYELDLISQINDAIGRQYSSELSDLLINQYPDLKSHKNITSDILELLSSSHTADVNWLNHTFFEDREVVKIGSDSSTQTSVNEISVQNQQDIDRYVITWFISKFKSAQSESMQYLTKRLCSVDWENADDPALPDGFDPIAYLLFNPDVLKAGALPYRHFIDSGQHEGGRKWNWDELASKG